MINTTSADPKCRVRCFAPDKVALARAALEQEEETILTLARMYEMLGNRTRLRILLALARQELCVCDVAHVLGLSIAATSHQLRSMHDRGWLVMRNDGKMVYYRLGSTAFREALQQGQDYLEAQVAS
ncbi:winged helix-turn-helix transcriptional regulator [Acidithiobacillus sp. VAN18-1]|uniref:Winged helix-turn-helix transcriptional regulator n=3 Tax=Acidithiobacillaceae TaxID=225058 RepID=A0AAE2YRF1_9PROT|nr:winged helix-turn-helix transcriptional regulator [Acidithiobacillus caldus]MBU2788696.1 winged helix-turn-helix transcriptional regulator [Igneacidithiobacillus copahuensis]MBU2795539.1 winged helix-turn-helix transcriptional regulator [Acidithiobacillus sp. VAN18-2]